MIINQNILANILGDFIITIGIMDGDGGNKTQRLY